MTAWPKVSAVIPVFNSERYLATALDSVMAQTRPPTEVIVVDDGSTDETVSVAAAYPGVQLLRQANAGPAAARNAGVQRATGELIAFLDADCTWHAHKLEVQVGVHAADPDLGYSFSAVREVILDGMEPPSWSRARMAPEHPVYGASPPGFVIRRDVFVALGGFDERLRAGEDAEFLARARASRFRERMLDEVLGEALLHGANLSMDRARVGQDLLIALHAARTRIRDHAGRDEESER